MSNVGWDVMGTGGVSVGVSFRSGGFLVVVAISKSIGSYLKLVYHSGVHPWIHVILDLLADHRPLQTGGGGCGSSSWWLKGKKERTCG